MRPELEDKINRLILNKLNPEPEPMDLDEFANYRISKIEESPNWLHLRHHGCSEHWVISVELMPPFKEVNLKNLMLEATYHWQESHRQD